MGGIDEQKTWPVGRFSLVKHGGIHRLFAESDLRPEKLGFDRRIYDDYPSEVIHTLDLQSQSAS